LNKAQAPLLEIVQLICSSFLYYEEYPLWILIIVPIYVTWGNNYFYFANKNNDTGFFPIESSRIFIFHIYLLDFSGL